MKLSVLLVCSFHLVLETRGGVVTQSECPSLDAVKLARLKSLVIKDDVHGQLVGTFSDLWGSKVLFDEDPDTCIKYSRHTVNDTKFAQFVHVKGKWFGGEQTRNSTLEKVENGVYLEVLHDVPSFGDLVLAKVYVLYAKNNVFAYFWCMMYTPPSNQKEASLPSLSGVAVPTQNLGNPLASDALMAVEEAVCKVQENKDILGEIAHSSSSC